MTLLTVRERAADALACAGIKHDVIALAMNVTRTVATRWLNPALADVRPAPLAMLLALDDADFEAVVQKIREARER